VSEADWSTFLAKVLTPAFPHGLTVYDAYGQIQQADGKIRRQSTRVVVIVLPRQPNKDASVSSVIHAYQRQFPGTKVMTLSIGVDQPQFSTHEENKRCHGSSLLASTPLHWSANMRDVD
jgi:hypothetical protein